MVEKGSPDVPKFTPNIVKLFKFPRVFKLEPLPNFFRHDSSPKAFGIETYGFYKTQSLSSKFRAKSGILPLNRVVAVIFRPCFCMNI